MNHDVFISYSSKNSTTAQAICHELEDNHIKCWMAPRDIPVGAKYASVIAQAIKSCKTVVLVFSEQSAISPWVESEINIAFSNRKPIVPYKIDAAVLEQYDEFYMMLNNRHWIESYPDFKTRFVELVEVVARLVDVELAPKANNVAPKDTAPKKPKATPTPSSAKTYKVGDYYNDGKKEGVVFWVDKSGEHGKIVSLRQRKVEWAVDKNFGGVFLNRYNPSNKRIGTCDKKDGKKNLDVVRVIECWQEKFPAFSRCVELGDEWYLPAIDELRLLLRKNVVELVNNTLAKYKNATIIFDEEALEEYWSSTESTYEKCLAETIRTDRFQTTSIKSFDCYVRAVATF